MHARVMKHCRNYVAQHTHFSSIFYRTIHKYEYVLCRTCEKTCRGESAALKIAFHCYNRWQFSAQSAVISVEWTDRTQTHESSNSSMKSVLAAQVVNQLRTAVSQMAG